MSSEMWSLYLNFKKVKNELWARVDSFFTLFAMCTELAITLEIQRTIGFMVKTVTWTFIDDKGFPDKCKESWFWSQAPYFLYPVHLYRIQLRHLIILNEIECKMRFKWFLTRVSRREFSTKKIFRHCIQIEWSFGSNSKTCSEELKPEQELI